MFLVDSNEPKLSQKKMENFYVSQENTMDRPEKANIFMSPTPKINKKKEKKDNLKIKENAPPKVTKAKEICLTEEEKDCLNLVKTYFKSGQYAHDLFFKVSSNVWKHYDIHSLSKQNYIVQTAKREVNFQKEDEESP
jgi:hypothetical protein